MKKLKILVAACLCFPLVIQAQVYKDKNASIDERVEDLLSRMTLEEKIQQLHNQGEPPINEFESRFGDKSIGTVHDMQRPAKECAVIYKELHKYMKEKTRLGIPVLTGVEGIQGLVVKETTLFPHAIAQGSTFNPDLIEEMTNAAGREAEVIGIHQILSPVLDISRDPRWGRVEETYGEDPFLISEMGVSFVKGYQHHKITCMPKHYVAHGSPMGGINCNFVSGGERELRSLYLYPFAKVIKEANPLAVMSCYSAYDGIALSGSRYYMTDILRGELGFKGYVYSDWGSVYRLKSYHHVAGSDEEAGRQGLIAGVDLNIDQCYNDLEKQVKEHKLDVEYINTAVRRILKVKFMLGMFEQTNGDPDLVEKVVRCPEHVALSKKVADESAILVQNNGILPLKPNKYKRIAVLGPNSNQTVFGDYSWTNYDTKEGVTLYQGLKNVFGNDVQLIQEDGCDWWSDNDKDIKKAVAAAKRSDLAIIAVGTRSTYLARNPTHSTAGEGFDMSSLELPGKQLDLIKAVKKTGKPIVVVLISGKPLVMEWVKNNVDAVLVQWYAGEKQGDSAAEILTGKVNPSGRLNVSFPLSTGNIPCFYNRYPSNEDGTRSDYIDGPRESGWGFGYGLSYTTFDYKACRLNKKVFEPYDDVIKMEVDVQNTGDREGKEVVQVYVKDKVSSVVLPVQQLKAFKKVSIEPGQTETVKLEIPISELALYNDRMQHIVEPGEFEIQIGKSAKEIIFNETIRVQ